MHPGGTVTFLFTDIEGSTRLWEAHPAAMPAAFARHESIIRQAIAAHNGYTYKMIGDAFQSAFTFAHDALAAAVEIQRRLADEPWGETPIRVRIALHTGETEERADDYVGPALNRLARLLAAGSGGQTLLTQAAAGLVSERLPAGVELLDLGEHHLRDLVQPERIYQAAAPGLQSDFPPLKTADTQPNNLPLPLTSFIGREKESAALRELLTGGKARLVTLAGSGGIGKTRLSLEVAAGLLEYFPDGVWLVELAPISDSEALPKLVANVLGVRETAEKPLAAALREFLRPKKMLLILDNCEHVIDACAVLADMLLRASPGLTILASSREILGIGGETALRVPPLSTPGEAIPAECTGSEAVRLFVERAQAAAPGFTLDDENACCVAQIVKRLDGIPLAIELAAARVRMLTPQQIAARLDDVFRLLTGGSRSVLPRHQALRALIDWSYNLLSGPERRLFCRLAVFSGGWTLDAAEFVCADPPESAPESAIAAEAVLDLLTQLVDKSLVLCYQEDGGAATYRMMETIRQYAHEKLVERGESAGVRTRHLLFFTGMALQAEPLIRTRAQVAWLERLGFALDNLRLALMWAMQTDRTAGLRLASALMWFWHIRGLASEGAGWLSQGLGLEPGGQGGPPPDLPAEVHAKALLTLGILYSMNDHPASAAALLQEGLELYQAMGPAGLAGVADAHCWLANSAYWMQDLPRSQAMAHQALLLYRSAGNRFGQSEALSLIGGSESDPGAAKAAFLEALALKREIGDTDGIAFTLQSLSQLAFNGGDFDLALEWLEESLQRFREVGNRQYTAIDLRFKASIMWKLGDYNAALQWIDEAVRVGRDSGSDREYGNILMRKGDIYLARGDLAGADGVYTEALRLNERTGDRRAYASALAALGKTDWLRGQAAQAEERWQQALDIGLELNYRRAIALARCARGKRALWEGQTPQAGALLEQGLETALESNDWSIIAALMDVLAGLAERQGEPERAARLYAAAERQSPHIEQTFSPPERDWRSESIRRLRAALGESRFSAGWQAGEGMTRAQIVALLKKD